MINSYYNGIYADIRDISIPLSDRSIYFGDAVYEMILGRNKRVYQLDEHLLRLRRSCELTAIDYPFGIEKAISKLLESNSFELFSIYVQVGRCADERLHAPLKMSPSSLLVVISEISELCYPRDIKAITYKDSRYALCNIKSVNLLPNVLASIEARNSGAEEAIFVKGGTVTEGAKSNVLILTDDGLKTHPLSTEILPGITRRNILDAAVRMGIPVKEEKFSVAEMFRAREIILSSTTKLIRRVCFIDGITVGGRSLGTVERLYDMIFRDFLQKTN